MVLNWSRARCSHHKGTSSLQGGLPFSSHSQIQALQELRSQDSLRAPAFQMNMSLYLHNNEILYLKGLMFLCLVREVFCSMHCILIKIVVSIGKSSFVRNSFFASEYLMIWHELLKHELVQSWDISRTYSCSLEAIFCTVASYPGQGYIYQVGWQDPYRW